MKRTSLLQMLLAISALAFAQTKPLKFTKAEQIQIQQILGKDFTAALSKNGQLVIVAPDKVGQLRSTAKGGFTGITGLETGESVFKQGPIDYKQSGEDLKLKLGQERFNQLGKLLAKKGIQ